MYKLDRAAITAIIREYQKDEVPWFIGYSGGKDSSALLKLVFNAMLQVNKRFKPITVLYCNTGVENPITTEFVKRVFKQLKIETVKHNLPFKFKILSPDLEDRFFVKVIGRGYPTPTNKFRWCTDKLRIKPVRTLIEKLDRATILLGIRLLESEQRDRTILEHKTEKEFYLKQAGSAKSMIFSPVLNHGLENIWLTLHSHEFPKALDYNTIRKIYQDAEIECPSYGRTQGPSCGKSRFGCWTCTVVRKDKSIGNMVNNGYEELKELFNFRNWISDFRDNPTYRCEYRRNGKVGLGPFTLEGRQIILHRLLEAEKKSGLKLISKTEIERIYKYWVEDINNVRYKEKAL